MPNSAILLLQQLSKNAEDDKANGVEWNVFPNLLLKLLNVALSTKNESSKHRFQNEFMSKTTNLERIDFVLEDFDMFKVIAKFSIDLLNGTSPRVKETEPMQGPECSAKCIEELKQRKSIDKLPMLTLKENELIKDASNCVKMQYNDKEGRIIVADRDIEAGELVMVEKAFVAWLRPSLYSTHCHHCLLPLSTSVQCPQCSLVKFCSSLCLCEAMKNYHKIECKYLPVLKYFAAGHLALRILNVVGVKNVVEWYEKENIGLETWTSRVYNSDYESLLSLVDHINDKSYQLLFPDVFGAALMSILAHKMGFIEGNDMRKVGAMLLKHISQIGCNVMSIVDDKTCLTDNLGSKKIYFSESLEIGAGMYPTVCLMNHSCDPNVLNSFYGNFALSTVLEKVTVGEELLVTYGPHVKRMSFKDRQKILKNRYSFECRCEACIEKKENLHDAIRCSNCKESVIVNVCDLSIKCERCGNSMNAAAVEQRFKEANDLLLDYFKCMTANLKFEAYIKLTDCHRILEALVNESHHLLTLAKQEMAVMYETRFRFSKALEIASQVKDTSKRCRGEQSLIYILSLLRFTAISINAAKYENKSTDASREMVNTALELFKNVPSKEKSLNHAFQLQIQDELQDIFAALKSS